MVRDERGSFSVPLGLLFIALAIGAFGILAVLRNWRSKVVIQLEIDRCVGLSAQELRDTLSHLGELNAAMVATRASLAASTLLPAARAPLQAALEVEMTAQDLVRAKWAISMVRWLGQRGCRAGGGDIPKPLPGLELQRPLPDALGAKPLEWEPGASKSYTIRLAHPPRYSAATVSPKDEDDDDDSDIEDTAAGEDGIPTSWQAVWSNPSHFTGRFLSP